MLHNAIYIPAEDHQLIDFRPILYLLLCLCYWVREAEVGYLWWLNWGEGARGFLCWNSGWLVVLNKPLGGLILLIVVDGSPSSYTLWAKNGKKCNEILLIIRRAREVLEFYCLSSSTYPEKNSSKIRGFLNKLGHSLGKNKVAQNVKIYHKWSILPRPHKEKLLDSEEWKPTASK